MHSDTPNNLYIPWPVITNLWQQIVQLHSSASKLASFRYCFLWCRRWNWLCKRLTLNSDYFTIDNWTNCYLTHNKLRLVGNSFKWKKKQKGFKLSEVRTNVCVFKVHLSTFKLASFNSLFGLTFSSVMNLEIESAKPLRSQTVPLRALARIKSTHFLKYPAVTSFCAKYTQKSLRGWDIWCSVSVIATLQTAQHGKRFFSCFLEGIKISAEENV